MNASDVIEIISLQDRFNSMSFAMSTPMRTTYIISECYNAEKADLLNKFISEQNGLVTAPEFTSSGKLFEFLKQHANVSIIFESEILSKRIEYIRVLEGAIFATPHGNPWKVHFGRESFLFNGKIVITSRLRLQELKKIKKLSRILVEAVVI